METEQFSATTLQTYFKEVIYGGIDGIVTTFAVVAGFSGAALTSDTATQLSFLVVLLFGLANLFADAASMGLGSFLSVRSEKDLYMSARTQEEKRILSNPESVYQETITILSEKNFSVAEATTIANTYRGNTEYWLDFLMAHSQELSDPRGENPTFTGVATFGAFMLFGAVPLLPFLISPAGTAQEVFVYSIIATLFALIALGLLKWRVIGTSFIRSVAEVVLIGSTAAILAFLVGTFFAL